MHYNSERYLRISRRFGKLNNCFIKFASESKLPHYKNRVVVETLHSVACVATRRQKCPKTHQCNFTFLTTSVTFSRHLDEKNKQFALLNIQRLLTLLISANECLHRNAYHQICQFTITQVSNEIKKMRDYISGIGSCVYLSWQCLFFEQMLLCAYKGVHDIIIMPPCCGVLSLFD